MGQQNKRLHYVIPVLEGGKRKKTKNNMSAINNCKGFTNLVETINHNSKLNKPQVQEKSNTHIDYSSQNI